MSTRRGLKNLDRPSLDAAPEGDIKEGPRAVALSAFCRYLRGSRERAHSVGGRLAARHLALIEIHDLSVVGGQGHEPGQQGLDVLGTDAGECLLAVLQSLFRRNSGLEEHLSLSHHLLGSVEPVQISDEEVVRGPQSIEVAQTDGELLELGSDVRIGGPSAYQLSCDAHCIGGALHLNEAFEGSPESVVSNLTDGCLDVPLHELRRDNPFPTQSISEVDVCLATWFISLVSDLHQRCQGVIALTRLLMKDRRPFARHSADFDLVALNLDELGQVGGHLRPILCSLGQLAEASNGVIVFGVHLADNPESADGAWNVLQPLLIELCESLRDRQLFLLDGC